MAGFRLLVKRGTDEERRGQVFASGEPVWTTDLKQLWVGDGVTAGGVLVSGSGGGGGGPVAWADIVGKPTTFPPSAHTHVIAWADITGKPATFPPSSHTHAIADVTGLAAELAAIDVALDTKLAIGTGVAAQRVLVGQGPATAGGDPNLTWNGAKLAISGRTASVRYRHVQGSASATWVIVHNLDEYPSVTVVDSSGNVCMGDIKYDSTNQITLSFGAAFSGSAYLN